MPFYLMNLSRAAGLRSSFSEGKEESFQVQGAPENCSRRLKIMRCQCWTSRLTCYLHVVLHPKTNQERVSALYERFINFLQQSWPGVEKRNLEEGEREKLIRKICKRGQEPVLPGAADVWIWSTGQTSGWCVFNLMNSTIFQEKEEDQVTAVITFGHLMPLVTKLEFPQGLTGEA